MIASLRKNAPLIAGTIAAHVGLFVVISLALIASFCVVFFIGVNGFARLAEWQHPGSLEGPLTALGPMLAAGFATVILHIAVLGVLAYHRVPLTKFFFLFISVAFLSLIAAWYIEMGLLRYTKGWYPVLRTPIREYPILALTPDQQPGRYIPHIVLWSDLDKFRRENPEYSFLIPEGQDSDLLSQLPRHDWQWVVARQATGGELRSARFEVTLLANGRQKIIVQGSWLRNNNASVESWYEAETRNVYPKYMIEGDTWGYYQRTALLLVGSIDLALLAFYFRRQWKKIQWPFEDPGPQTHPSEG
jgi:hypothetical protein